MRLVIALILSLLSGNALAQGMGGMFPGPGTPHTAGAAYVGPGDVVSGATTWGSCARVYTTALASTSTQLCDLVDSTAPTVVICTLRGSASGFVDLAGAYCTGSVTPAVKCAAATGGVCNVSQLYDQTGGGKHWTQATAANQPILAFSALNSLPGMTCVSASGRRLDTAQTMTIGSSAGPMTFTAVAKRTANNTTEQSIIGAQPSVPLGIRFAPSVNTVSLAFNTSSVTQGSQADNSFHAINGVMDTTSTIASDGSSSTGTLVGSAVGSGQGLRMCRENGGSFPADIVVMEVGAYLSTAFSAGQITSMNSNQHGSNGYNF